MWETLEGAGNQFYFVSGIPWPELQNDKRLKACLKVQKQIFFQ